MTPDQDGRHTLAPTRPSRVLLVDDEEVIRVVGKELLLRRGFTVITAAGGAEAILLIQNEAECFECVILDLVMPAVDGAAVFRCLRECRPTVPVLLASGCEYEDALQHIPLSGNTAFILKPWRSDALFAAISRLLQRRV